MKACIVIAGASSGIAQALFNYWYEKFQSFNFLLITRRPEHLKASLPTYQSHFANRVSWLAVDLSQASSVDTVSTYVKTHQLNTRYWINCCGFLHNAHVKPEKSLQQLSVEALNINLQGNLHPHIHFAQIVNNCSQATQRQTCINLSALVGSISENYLGGWYSYRMSKAALNMLVKNISIEWRRRYPSNIIVAVHPGTTDTKLSKPFQANIDKEKLYSAQLTAQRLTKVIQGLTVEDSGRLLHWDATAINY
ncbi:SDR family NAD(P)-dependent oxidoreductase [Catenovulum sediminis]|uniref:SDR family NAD(P)-dependent oxidoreductase n=1 Tax=Catenovulum sediminis TaxID=1740262 RepID=A0ABV1RJJ0_9ALTE